MIAFSLGQCVIWRLQKNNFQCCQLFVCFIIKCPSSSSSSPTPPPPPLPPLSSSFKKIQPYCHYFGLTMMQVAPSLWVGRGSVSSDRAGEITDFLPEWRVPCIGPSQITNCVRFWYHWLDLLNGAPKSHALTLYLSPSLLNLTNYIECESESVKCVCPRARGRRSAEGTIRAQSRWSGAQRVGEKELWTGSRRLGMVSIGHVAGHTQPAAQGLWHCACTWLQVQLRGRQLSS